jgi:hypothetical protein
MFPISATYQVRVARHAGGTSVWFPAHVRVASGTQSASAVRFAVDGAGALFGQIQGIHGTQGGTMGAPD